MSMRWSDCRLAARQGQLSYAQLRQLVEQQAATGHWQRLERWLPTLIRHGVGVGERQGSAIALADWFLNQQRQKQARSLIALVTWTQADAQAWILRGLIELALGATHSAEHHFIQALVRPGGRAMAAYRLGQLQRCKGAFDLAISWFLASLSCDPEPIHIHHELQFTRGSTATLPELVGLYEHLCQQQPERGLFRHLLAHYLQQQGQHERAIAEARRASRLELGDVAQFLAPATAQPTPPDFLILGAPKGGTTAVAEWLNQLPGLWCHPRKELHFFNGANADHSDWYCAQFPRFRQEAGILRGEATPAYFSDPNAPERISTLMPNARLVVLLREPLSRAISWVKHLQRVGEIRGEVWHWLEQELNHLEPLSREELRQHPRIGTGALQDSCYDLHLQRWLQHNPGNPPLLLSSDRLFSQPEPELSKLLRFLQPAQDAKPWLTHWQARNVNPVATSPCPPQLAMRLQIFLDQHNRHSLKELA